MADMSEFSVRDYSRTIKHEALKLYRIYDASQRVVQQFEAPINAVTGDLCLKTQYAYIGSSLRVQKMKESLAYWDSSWDQNTSVIPMQGLSLWLKADTGTYQDTNRTIAASVNGQTVDAWADQSGQNNHAVYWRGSHATLATDNNGHKFLNPGAFPGVGFTIGSGPTFSAFTLFVVLLDYGNSNGHGLVTVTNDSAYNWGYYTPNGIYLHNWSPGGADIIAPGYVAHTIQLLVTSQSASGQTAQINNSTMASDSVAQTYQKRMQYLGEGNWTTLSNAGSDVSRYYEVIAYNRVLTSEERAQVKNYLNAKFSIY